MKITDWSLEQQEDTTEISANVDGFRLWYRVPAAYSVSRMGDPFLAAALLPAMLKGETLAVDSSMPVSPKLLAGIDTLQEIHHCWNPVLRKIHISARMSPSEPLNAGVFSFFSGGVDSMYTFLKRMNDLTHVVFIQGFDFYADPETYRVAVERNRSFVESFGKTLIPVETNHYPFGYRYNLSRNLTQGSALASVALLLGFPRVFIPSAYAYDQLIPLGSHPLTDPLYSSDSVEIVHEGAEARRVEKIAAIAKSEASLANLMVCFTDMNANCGRCAKCLRTMIPLRLLKTQGPFPSVPSLEGIRKMHIGNEIEAIFIAEARDCARQMKDESLCRALSACMARFERRQLVKQCDRVALGGVLKRVYRHFRKNGSGIERVDTTPTPN